MIPFTRAYGSRPLHLLSLVACFALAGYTLLRVRHDPHLLEIGLWFVGAVIGHDLVLLPLYSLADVTTGRLSRRRAVPVPLPWLNYLRVPALLSGLLLLIWFPLIFGLGQPTYRSATGLGTGPYLARWLLVTGVLFAVSAVLYAVRLRMVARGRQGQPTHGSAMGGPAAPDRPAGPDDKAR